MPVLLAWRNKRYHSRRDNMLLIFCGYDSFAFGDNKNLLSRMIMKLVACAGCEPNQHDLELRGFVLFFQNKLGSNLSSEEQWVFRYFLWLDIFNVDYFR